MELKPDGINLTLSLAVLIPTLDIRIKIIRDIPMVMKRRGVEMRMIIGDPLPSLDSKLIKAVVLANKWFNELATGQVKKVADIALREGVDKSYVNRVINLAFLAPNITEEIIAGRQPSHFSVEMLTKHVELSFDWDKQQHLLVNR